MVYSNFCANSTTNKLKNIETRAGEKVCSGLAIDSIREDIYTDFLVHQIVNWLSLMRYHYNKPSLNIVLSKSVSWFFFNFTFSRKTQGNSILFFSFLKGGREYVKYKVLCDIRKEIIGRNSWINSTANKITDSVRITFCIFMIIIIVYVSTFFRFAFNFQLMK